LAYLNEFPKDYEPKVFDIQNCTVNVEGKDIDFELCDTTGQEDYDKLRPLSYSGADVFILCYSVGNHKSFENAESKWYPQIRHHVQNVPIILCGTKTELRKDKEYLENIVDGKLPLEAEDGKQLAKKIHAVKYCECSVHNRDGIKNVFDEALLATLYPSVNNVSLYYKF
jgi:small GTP-binding protein